MAQVAEPLAGNYVNGAWEPSQTESAAEIVNPATGESLARIALAGEAEVARAVAAAARAFPAWRRTPPQDRIQFLFRFRDILLRRIDDLARSITLENGKTLAESKAEVQRGIENVEVACGTPTMMQGYNLEDVASG
ncbi:MAG: aldehyde dehydrogenase family protein, partial [Candidatus Binataceae bacterium]